MQLMVGKLEKKNRPPPFLSPGGGRYADPQHIAQWCTADERIAALRASGVARIWQAGALLGHGGFATVLHAGSDAVVKITQSKTDGRALAALHRAQLSAKPGTGLLRVLGYKQIFVWGVPHVAARIERVLDHKHIEREDYLALWLAMEHFADKVVPRAPELLEYLDAEPDRALARRAASSAVTYAEQLRAGWDWLRRNAMLPEADVHIENVGIAPGRGAVWLDMGSGEYDDFLAAVPVEKGDGMRLPKRSDVANAFPRLRLLLKADAPAPGGAGWQHIPKGRKGGYRRRHGAGWEYWYPTAHAGQQGGHREPAETESGWSEADLAAGRYDSDPSKWHFVRPEGSVEPTPWVHGGVDPESAHPVKVMGQEHKLYRVKVAEAEPGWAVLVNVHDASNEVLVRHERIAPVEYGLELKAPAPEAAEQEEEPRRPGGKRSSGWVAGSAQKLPPYPGSTAAAGTALQKLESGQYPSKLRRQFAEDADGVPRMHEERVAAVPDADRLRLLEEFAPLIKKVAKKELFRVGVQPTADNTSDMQSAAMEGLLHALEEYRGGSSFALSAQFMCSQHARLQALRELRGGLYLPKRHARLLPGFLAARAEAFRMYGHDPSAKEVASVWRLKKRDVHDGLTQGRDDILPMSRYSLKGQGFVEGDERPGKIEWAERYLQMLEGQKNPKQEQFFADPFLFGSGAGAGMTAEEKLINSRAVSDAFTHLTHFEQSFGGQTYRVDASDVLRRHLGFGGEPESWKEVSRHVRISRKVGESWKLMSERGAEAVLPELAERALLSARKHLEGEQRGLIDRAAALASEPEPIAPGLTAFLHIEAEARALSREEIREWRANERQRLRKLEQRYRSEGNIEYADGAKRAHEQLASIGLKRARMLLAEQRLMSRPRNREWFRTAVPIPVEVDHPEKLGHMVVTLTDPSTGQQRRVRMRTSGKAAEVKKSEALNVPDEAAVRRAVMFPRLSQLLFGSSDPLATGAAPSRIAALELAGILR